MREALKTWQLYALWAVFFLNTTAGLAILSEARVMAVSIGGASATLAAAFIMITSASDAVGRLLWPALSDRIGGRGVFLAMFGLQAVAFSLMPTLAVGSLASFCALCMLVMSCYGGGYGTNLGVGRCVLRRQGKRCSLRERVQCGGRRQLRRARTPGALGRSSGFLLSGPLRDGGSAGSRRHHRLDVRSAQRPARAGVVSPD